MKKEKGRIHQGFNLTLYSRLFDEFVEPNKPRNISGHLMVDELKIKLGVYFNSNTYEVTGFEADGDGINIDEEIKKDLIESKNNKNTSNGS